MIDRQYEINKPPTYKVPEGIKCGQTKRRERRQLERKPDTSLETFAKLLTKQFRDDIHPKP